MILDRILEHKKAELRHKQSRGYLADLKAAIRDAPPALGFAVTLDATKPPTSPSLIAEVKKASPSLGLLRDEFAEKFDHLGLARIYREQGASAVSVLTDKHFFQGDLQYLKEVKQALPIPALNKEFMVGDIQFYEARAHGADAILLIVAALEKRQLIDFHALATELGMDGLGMDSNSPNDRDQQSGPKNLHDGPQRDVPAGQTHSIRQVDHQRKRDS